jgi:carbamoyl-phosphate synthase (ammonia)
MSTCAPRQSHPKFAMLWKRWKTSGRGWLNAVTPEPSTSGAIGGAHAVLELEDGSRWVGTSFGYEGNVDGEIVFNTGMVGYTESLTDPSYHGQFLVSTYPLVGNYGVPCHSKKDNYGITINMESDKIWAKAFIAQDYSHAHSHWDADKSLSQWLVEHKVPGIYNIDTRALTKRIRDKGAMLARITFDLDMMETGTLASAVGFDNPNERNLIAEVSRKDVRIYGEGNPVKILAVDCGIKNNMLRHLCKRGCEVKVVPWNHDITKEPYDGLFLSNGPGNPEMAAETTEFVRQIISGESGVNPEHPIFGICMGNQLLGTAAGAQTYKMPFGNRGQNVPVLNVITGACTITPQNHGYALNVEQLPDGWAPLFVNRNDGTNEGVYHIEKPFFSAQFHPESRGGPTDTEHFFDLFVKMSRERLNFGSVGAYFEKLSELRVDKPEKPKKILMLGSGGLSIGQAGEFDYSGSQAIKAFKEEGVEVVLMNPNIASVQTNLDGDVQADIVYFMPVTPEYVEEVIKKEQVDGIVLSMGGQTALNCGVEMHNNGIFQKYKVRVLGTQIESIMDTEDRDRFSVKLNEIGEHMAPSVAVDTVQDALEAAKVIGYPCMIRSAYALGGLGSGICADSKAMEEMASKALSTSPQILVEKSMLGWKELEYEVVRDVADNCITVCNMENFDPLGVHTGDSIVIAPSQTLSNDEYHMLRETALKTVRHMGIIGECNIQYALHPTSKEYCIIEINPRLSRSSALASKATGYPLAFVAAKLSLGYELPDLRNNVTEITTACFEPSLDYVVTKVPRWDLEKFDKVSRSIGSAMKSVGEVMAVGRTFEESIQKALRMVGGSKGFDVNNFMPKSEDELTQLLVNPSDTRVNAIAYALKQKWSVQKLHELTNIDPWFLHRLDGIVKTGKRLEDANALNALRKSELKRAKQLGFSDAQIASHVGCGATEDDVRAVRIKQFGIVPVVKQIDTMAAEYPAATNYLYMTYNGTENDLDPGQGSMVLGSGTYRIGSSVEFDWCSVSAIRTLRTLGRKTVVVNCNPETVSTDYDECDRLYFEELSKERVLDIYERENCDHAIVSVGGQIPNGLANPLHDCGVNILGTTPEMIDNAEDRKKFSDMCDRNGIDQPAWSEMTSIEDAFTFAEDVGYPVLVRPSYVLSGAAMNVAYTPGELAANLSQASEVSADKPVVISKFIEGGREIDVDAVALNGRVLAHAVSEHVENAGVHSGDATLMLPTQSIPEDELERVRDTVRKVAVGLKITGPFNMQLIAKDGKVKIIETNVRASRSFPFSSKTTGVDFIECATRAMVGAPLMDLPVGVTLGAPGETAGKFPATFVGVKSPMFSFKRLLGADPTLGVEMASTGEVACYGATKEEAFLKSMLATTLPMPKNSVLVSIQAKLRDDFLPSVVKFQELGYTIYATEQTATFLEENNIPVTKLDWPTSEEHTENVASYIRDKKIDLVLMFANTFSERVKTNYDIRRLAVDYGVPLLTNIQVAQLLADAIEKNQDMAKKGDNFMKIMTLREYYEKEALEGLNRR